MNPRNRDPRDILAGIFLILFGLGFTLAGGGCTVAWVAFLYGALASESPLAAIGLFWLLVSIICAGVGALSIEHGIRRLRIAAKDDDAEA
jgi:hypothetical protein